MFFRKLYENYYERRAKAAERRFFKKLNARYEAQKEAIWKRIVQALEEDKREEEAMASVLLPAEQPQVLATANPPRQKRWRFVPLLSAVCALVLVFTVCFSLPIPKRYGSTVPIDDYTSVHTYTTLRDYGAEIGAELLYVDWYEDGGYANQMVVSKESGEIFLFKESVYMPDYGLGVMITVSEGRNDYYWFDVYYDFCKQTTMFGSTEVHWLANSKTQIAYFEYKGFWYYIDMIDVEAWIKYLPEETPGQHMLWFIGEMFKSAEQTGA